MTPPEQREQEKIFIDVPVVVIQTFAHVFITSLMLDRAAYAVHLLISVPIQRLVSDISKQPSVN
jgi:hypothetical protein